MKEIVGELRVPLAYRPKGSAIAALTARNVEFYTALLLDAVGLPRELFTPAFAIGRVIGWCAHVMEQETSGRLIRPAARYTGPLPAGAVDLRLAG